MSAPRATVARDAEPTIDRGHHVWRGRLGAWRILCRGRPVDGNGDLVECGPPDGVEVARLRQVHSDGIAVASPGPCGEGDALVVTRAGLAATIVTADCVPVAIGAGPVAAAVHAGWRGIASGIVPKVVARLRERGAGELVAWIGPAIGACCYEVGEDVASRVVRSSAPSSRIAPEVAGHAPRLDLRHAVRVQLEASGVAVVGEVALCTRCHSDWLWSFRRDGPAAGRIETFLWRE